MATSAELIRLLDIVSPDPDIQDAVVITKEDTINLVDTRVAELYVAIAAVESQVSFPNAYGVAYGVTNVGAALDTQAASIGAVQATVTTLQGNVTTLQGQMTTAQADITNIQGGSAVTYLARSNHTGVQSAATISDFSPSVQTEIIGQKGVANGICPLDSGALVDAAYLPAIAITDTFVVASEAAMLALTAQKGDVAIRTDISTTFILVTSPATTLANWSVLLVPGGAVTSVALSLPGIFSVTGSPVTSSGTLAASLVNQSPNQLWAGPSSDGASTPAFRSLVPADIPGLDFAKITTGVVPVAQGGTGLSSVPTNGQIPIGNATGFSLAAISAGSGISVTNGAGTITIANTSPSLGGTVTSVGLGLPGIFTVTGSPVTGAGTLSASLATQLQNRVWAGPITGAATAPTFRALVEGDIPALPASIITTGLVPAARGGTGVDGSAATSGAIPIGNGAGFILNTITGTADQVTVINSAGSITLQTPQGISSSNSPAFAGITISGNASLGAMTLGRVSVSTTYSVAAGLGVVFADSTGGTFTITLPSAVSFPGRIIRIKRTSSTNNTVTVASAAGNIDGSATYALSGVGTRPSAAFCSDGTNWWLVGVS